MECSPILQSSSVGPHSDVAIAIGRGGGWSPDHRLMTCDEFRERFSPIAGATEDFLGCMRHVRECTSCGDYMAAVELERKGVDLSRYPCVHMARSATFECEQHPDVRNCPDAIVIYDPRFDQYAINAPAPAVSAIRFCPWCGAGLPDRSREWLRELEQLGFDDPYGQPIPARYYTDEWYRKSTSP